LEDTETAPSELEELFGPEVRRLVEEVTDDKTLEKSIRKELQVRKVAGLSPRAKMIRIADKICNVRDVSHSPPTHWGSSRRREYFDWTERVVTGCLGVNVALEQLFHEVLREGREILAKSL
jgi:guanosine-3',5'-bis(diphosphate) 3'-pyrophosphohydrolase